jgi:probable HAF family extracellular repeat protein
MIDLDNVNRASRPESVNNFGEVAGYISVSGIDQAFFWNASGVKSQLPTLGGGQGYAYGINDGGYVIGWSQRAGKNTTAHAFLWHPNTGILDLNFLKSPSDTSGIELTSAMKITNAGQILASGVTKSGGGYVLLTPIP